MKVIIFGCGSRAYKYRDFIESLDIVCFVDNDQRKQNGAIFGKKIYAPDCVDYDRCDYVLITIWDSATIYYQLRQFGVSEEKILDLKSAGRIFEPPVISGSNKCDLDKWRRAKPGSTIAVILHEFSRTGVPVASKNLAILLKKMGYRVLIAGLRGGSFEQDLKNENIDYIKDIEMFMDNKKLFEEFSQLNLLIYSTIAVAEIANRFRDDSTPQMWWINESYPDLFELFKVSYGRSAFFYGDGEVIVNYWKTKYPNIPIKKMHYCVPDRICRRKRNSDITTFAVIGTICKRKGQDILLNAIQNIPINRRQKSEFVFVGAIIEEMGIKWNQISELVQGCKWIDEMSEEKLWNFYGNIDVLICPSREDSGPIVVTYAFQNNIPCIVSEAVGQSKLIKENKAGIVYETYDIKGLEKALLFMLNDAEQRKQMGIKGYKIYDSFFSEESMRNFLEKELSQILRN